MLSCMTYVDLNPIRAGIARDFEESEFTSVNDRLKDVHKRGTQQRDARKRPRLMPFVEALRQDQGFAGIPFNLRDYLELVDWTGRVVRQNKKGAIPASVPRVLTRLGFSDREWQLLALDIQKQSITMLNGLDKVAALKRSQRVQRAA